MKLAKRKKGKKTRSRKNTIESAASTVKLMMLHEGEVAEWSIAMVLKTIGPKGPGGSNPSLSAIFPVSRTSWCEINFLQIAARERETKQAI